MTSNFRCPIGDRNSEHEKLSQHGGVGGSDQLAAATAVPVSATWIDLVGTTASVTDFSQLATASTSNTRWVNDYGAVNRNTPTTGTTSYATGASQAVGWFANQATSATPTGGTGTIVGASSTVTTANSLPFAVNAGAAPSAGYNLFSSLGGTVAATDEALGFSPTDTSGNLAVGVAYRNGTVSVVNTLLVSYRGEQWRNSGAGAQSIEVSYAVFSSSTSITPSLNLDATVAPGGNTSLNAAVQWQAAPASSTFTSPRTGGSAAALDGNAVANSALLSFNLSNLNLQPGGYVLLRFRDVNNAGVTDHILAIDNVSVAIPEPSTWAAIVVAGAIAGGTWRRARYSAPRA